MREKIIGVFTVVVLLVSVLSFALMRATLGDLSNKGESQRAVRSAVAQLQVEGLRIERWLAKKAGEELLREPFDLTMPRAKSQSARSVADKVYEAAKRDGRVFADPPTMVVIFDKDGVVLGRNGSATLMKDVKLFERHTQLKTTIEGGQTGSNVWIAQAEQLLASYAPILNGGGELIGGVAIGTSLNDGRLQKTSEATSQSPIILASPDGDKLKLLAKSNTVTDEMAGSIGSAKEALNSDQVISLAGLPSELLGSAQRLDGYGDGKRAVVIAITPASLHGSWGSLIWPMLGCFALGLILTVLGAFLIDQYISRPIADLEDGLLAIINGDHEIRFELEHSVLGGLVFRINSLLNELLGIQEDDTDANGRPSMAPRAESFRAALNVDERMVSMSLEEVEDGLALRDEPPEDYYKRIYDEYIAAKQEVGDPVDHIRFSPFTDRIKVSERQMTDKHGKPFRYRIKVENKEVVLIAVPLA